MTTANGTTTADPAADYHRQRLADGAACLAAALGYLSLGWSVLSLCPPDHVGVGRKHGNNCKKPGKRPWHYWTEFQTRLPTEAEVRSWWQQHPNSNVGVALGPRSGIVRLDVEGEAALQKLQEISGGDLPPTLEFRSGRADGTGYGILFAIPRGVTFRTTPQFFQDGELRFQALGAQTALPPSRHKDGRLYEWLPGRAPGDRAVSPAPAWVVSRYAASSGPGHKAGVLATGEMVGAGGRNTFLTSLAGTLRRRGATEDEIRGCLEVFNLSRCDPPLDKSEVDTIARSVARYDSTDVPAAVIRPLQGRGRHRTSTVCRQAEVG